MTRSRRVRALNMRGNVAMSAAVAFGLFLAPAMLATGRWTPMHTRMAVALAGAGLTALVCWALAARFDAKDSPRGDSPQVTHPPAALPLTPAEVQK